MKNNSPQKHAFISCLILVTGILLVVIGAMTTKEYKINLCLLIGAIVVIGGIVYHLISKAQGAALGLPEPEISSGR